MAEDRRIPKRALAARARSAGGKLYVGIDEQVLELSDVGSKIWRLSNGKRDVDEIATALTGEYDVPIDVARRDVVDFLDGLVTAGLVEWTTAGP